jgi:hypothetical protein
MATKLQIVKEQLAEMKVSEESLRDKIPMLKTLWENMQAMKREMNEAKLKALAEIEGPYLETLTEAENKYAFYMQLTRTKV